MSNRQPPRLAAWLLNRLGCSLSNDAVIGDIYERYQRGKTKVWYWRQVVLAIVASALNEIRNHKLSTLLATIVACPIYWYLGYFMFALLGYIEKLWPSLTGFPDIAIGSLVMFGVGVVTGWILARLNNSHRRSTLLLFGLILLVAWICYSWTASPDDIGASPYWEAYFWMNNLLQVLGVLMGGLVEWRRRMSGIHRKLFTALPLSVLLIAVGIALSVSQPPELKAQDSAAGSIEGIVTTEGTSDPITGVQVSILLKGSLAATGFNAQQVLQAASRGANVNPELVQMAQDATRGGPRAAVVNAPPIPGITDAVGHFTVRNLSPGEYFVRAQLPGFFGPEVNGSRGPITGTTAFVVNAQPTEVRLTLIKGGTISGRVLDSGGKPLTNAPVAALVTNYEDGASILQPANQKSTDDRGEFRIGIVPPGEYYLAVVPTVANSRGGGATPGTSGSEAAVPTLYPDAVDAARAIPIVLHAGEDLSGMNIRMKAAPTYKISGRVTHTLPPGPAPGGRGGTRPLIATLALAPRDKTALTGLGPIGGVVTSSEDGSFEISNVPAGSYELFARLPIAAGWGALAPPERATAAWTIGRVGVEVRGGDLKDLSLVVNAGTEVKGHITMDGKPVEPANAGLRICFIPDDSAAVVSENQISQVYGQIAQFVARIEAGGIFTIPLLPPGHYRVEVLFTGGTAVADSFVSDIRQGSASVFDDGITLRRESANPIEITLNSRGGSLEGNVLGPDRKAAPNATLVVVPVQSRRQNPALYKTTTTNAQGHFVVTGIAPGSWKVFAWESVKDGAWQNAEYVRKFEERGTGVTVAAGVRTAVDVSLIRN